MDIKMIEYRGYKVGQAPSRHVAVFSPYGNLVLQGEQSEMLSEDELKGIVDGYIERTESWLKGGRNHGY